MAPPSVQIATISLGRSTGSPFAATGLGDQPIHRIRLGSGWGEIDIEICGFCLPDRFVAQDRYLERAGPVSMAYLYSVTHVEWAVGLRGEPVDSHSPE